MLREAQLVNGGAFLGPVGGRIVAEVLLGLLMADPDSYLNNQPQWQPSLGAGRGPYTMANFLTFAGVDPASRGQSSRPCEARRAPYPGYGAGERR